MSAKFNPERVVADYRAAVTRREKQTTDLGKARFEATAKRLREAWKGWQGEDSLHEIAFGEPVE